MRGISVLLLGWVWIGTGAPAHAQPSNTSSSPVYGQNGAYLQFGGSVAIEDFDLSSGIDVDKGFVVDPAIGYRLSRLIALELQGRYLDGLDIKAFGSKFDVDGWSVLFNAKIYLPVGWRAQPFVKFGGGYTAIELEGRDLDDASINIGAGAEYYLDESVALGFEGGRFEGAGDLNDFDYWNAGGFVKFLY